MQFSNTVEDSTGGWRRYKATLQLREADGAQDIERAEKEMNRGWCIGDRSYKKALADTIYKVDGMVYLEKEEMVERKPEDGGAECGE